MKKLSLVLVGLCASLTLLSCGKGDSAQTPSPTPSAGTKKPPEMPPSEGAKKPESPAGEGTRKPASPPLEAVKVSTEDLMDAYGDGNLIAADEKYKGKIIELTGVVAGIEKHTLGGINLFLEDKRKGVKCVLPATLKDQVLGLQSDDDVTVRGECRGKILGHILVEKCEWVHVVPPSKK
jgi:hypothetical protein